MSKDWIGNRRSIFGTMGASNHVDDKREENDYYATNPYAIDCLLQVETPTSPIWECACGEGALSERLKQFGYEVYSTDIVERNYKLDKKLDFFNVLEFGQEYDCDIITNPPYKYATEFVLHALNLVKTGRKVYMFLKILFLEGRERYNVLYKNYPPKTIYVFSRRVDCAKNGKHFLNGGAVAYAWYVWEKGWQGKTTIEWVNHD